MISTLVITGATVVDEGDAFAGTVTITDGKIVEVDRGRARGVAGPSVDATGCLLVPGFVDLQINGMMGVDLTSEPGRVWELADLLPTMGVTSFLPTVVSTSSEQTAHAIEMLDRFRRQPVGGARSLGVHLEGPYLEPRRRGAHPREHLRRPSRHEASGWGRAGGVSMVTLAPELPGALDVIADLTGRGVVVCAGHTAASVAELARAVAAGVRGATHLFNAMGPLSARDPGPAGAILAHPTLIAGLIADGLHVDPAMVTVAWRALGPRRLALVTDAMAAFGLAQGPSRIGDTDVIVDDQGVHTTDGVLAGSILSMDQAFRNLIAFTGCSPAEASLAASTVPARLLGRDDLGVIRAGSAADLVLLDDNRHVVGTIVGGRPLHDPQQRVSS